MAALLLHDAVFEPSSKVDTAAQTKLNGILRNSDVSQILRVAVDDHDEKWLDQSWKIPTLLIWDKMYHKYEGMTDMLTGTMLEELPTIITCVKLKFQTPWSVGLFVIIGTRESVLFIGTRFSILYTFMYSPA